MSRGVLLPWVAGLDHGAVACNCAVQLQVLMAVSKDVDGVVTSEALMDVGYVPLTRPSEFEDGQLPGL